MITLTNSPQRANPFGGSIKAFPYNFSEPHELEKSLRGIDVLINTYWVRFDNPPHFTFAQALANSKALFDAAKRAGIGRVVHISITNPDRKSRLPYFRGKAELEDYLKQTGISYAMLRPAVLFGKEDILINNIAWALRHLPVFGIYGDGRYRLQPIYIDDLAAAAIDRMTGGANETIDAIGPETYSYREMVEMIAREIGSRALLWIKTLLIVTHDEHGGCYDHVPPPSATQPETARPDQVFKFDRYGVRVPAVIVSPYVKPGTILRPPSPPAPPRAQPSRKWRKGFGPRRALSQIPNDRRRRPMSNDAKLETKDERRCRRR